MKNNLKKMGWALLIGLTFYACKKDQVTEIPTTPLSKNAPDLALRLAAIKEQYYDQKMDAGFLAKDVKGITWTPDWEKPRLETVNDSVSYVFFPMIGTVQKEGKPVKIQEIGAATYLMVKNEKDFYKAFYYVPEDKRSKNPSDDTSEAIMQHFTGSLLLSSLNGGRNYLLDYVNGKVSEAYKKNQFALKKLQSVSGATSYWEQQCRTEIRHCTFVSDSYSRCGGEIIVIYSYSCQWPTSYCGMTFYMTDSGEETVCEQVWFEDPPSGGGTGGGEDSPEPKAITEIKVDTGARPCVKTIVTDLLNNADDIKNVVSELMTLANINASAAITRLNDLNNYNITISEVLYRDRDVTDPSGQVIGVKRVNGRTDSQTGDIGINKLTLDEATDLAVASTLIHEMMHAYFVYGTKHATGSEQFFFQDMNEYLFRSDGTPIPDGTNQETAQHTQMAAAYVNSMASLLAKYATSRGILKSPDSSITLLEYCKDLFWRNLADSQAYIQAPNKTRAITNGDREFKNQSGTNKKGC